MGGIGSGRHWQFGSDATEGYRSIDVRWLKRERLLFSGISCSVTWSRAGEVTGSIKVRSEPGRIILDYRHKNGGEDWQDESYPVHLGTTPCHMGGERHWFLCPALGCGRRVAILYGGAIFACRHCHRLADRIRDKLGWPGGILEGGYWGKPKGMHWRTYERHCAMHDDLLDIGVAGFVQRFGALADRQLGIR